MAQCARRRRNHQSEALPRTSYAWQAPSLIRPNPGPATGLHCILQDWRTQGSEDRAEQAMVRNGAMSTRTIPRWNRVIPLDVGPSCVARVLEDGFSDHPALDVRRCGHVEQQAHGSLPGPSGNSRTSPRPRSRPARQGGRAVKSYHSGPLWREGGLSPVRSPRRSLTKSVKSSVAAGGA